eukprot:1144275-Pelagomonas_calceolata.AAC.4
MDSHWSKKPESVVYMPAGDRWDLPSRAFVPSTDSTSMITCVVKWSIDCFVKWSCTTAAGSMSMTHVLISTNYNQGEHHRLHK